MCSLGVLPEPVILDNTFCQDCPQTACYIMHSEATGNLEARDFARGSAELAAQ